MTEIDGLDERVMSDQTVPAAPSNSSAGVQSVEIGARILDSLTKEDGQPVPLREVAQRTGLNPAKVHRYLSSLVRVGLAAQEQVSGHYQIGTAAIRLGLIALRSISPLKLVVDALPNLRDRAQETAVVAVWSGHGATVISMLEPAQPVTMNVRVGSVLPAKTSALGQIFLAYDVDHGIRMSSAESQGIAAAREAGFTAVHSELLPGVNAIAAPIFDHDGKVVCAVGLVGPESRLPIDREADIQRQLVDWCNTQSAALGHPNH